LGEKRHDAMLSSMFRILPYTKPSKSHPTKFSAIKILAPDNGNNNIYNKTMNRQYKKAFPSK